MKELIKITNPGGGLDTCRDSWFFDREHDCWCLEDVLYTQKAAVPKFQRLSIFVPAPYMSAPGVIAPCGSFGKYTSATVPVVFENNSAGYMQMPHTWLGGPRCYAEQYLKRGFVYVSCGCRGRESRDSGGRPVGKSPAALVDLKTAIRFLRHNRTELPGDWDRVISTGWSAGGAMSTLLAVSGNNAVFNKYLEDNGAFMGESDAVYAAQIYCPIIDLQHADLAYEWLFRADKTCEDSPAGPSETMTPFKEALSARLSVRYVDYFNALGLHAPDTGEALTIGEDGRSGSAYTCLMSELEASASDFLRRLGEGTLELKCSVDDYLDGRYTELAPAPPPPLPPDAPPPPSLGDLVSRPPEGMPAPRFEPPMMPVKGDAKRSWLSWDGERAHITCLDDYVLGHRRRMKPCTSFDKLSADSGENQEFGSPEHDFLHFSPDVADELAAMSSVWPEAAAFAAEYRRDLAEPGLEERVRLIDPYSFIGRPGSTQAEHFRIRVGARDADTAPIIGLTLALTLQNNGKDTDYALVWDQPHSEADYPGEVCDWIDSIC